jgi:hypothetical protein
LSGDFDRPELKSGERAKFPIEALAGASFSILHHNDLLGRLLNHGAEYHPLLKWIEIRFLSAAGLETLAEHLAFSPEWVWCGVVDHLIRPWLDRVIVSDFLEDFRGQQFWLL